jgi:hypothetical protein
MNAILLILLLTLCHLGNLKGFPLTPSQQRGIYFHNEAIHSSSHDHFIAPQHKIRQTWAPAGWNFPIWMIIEKSHNHITLCWPLVVTH